MKKISIFLVCLIANNYSYGQNLNFSDAKFKKLLLTSNATNNIALDKDNKSFAIDVNNDGEISLDEANQVKILNLIQDPKFKYKSIKNHGTEEEPELEYEINEEYYNEHLPNKIIDLLLFKNVEEIYLQDVNSVNISFKNNDKLKIFKYDVDYGTIVPPEHDSLDKNVTFENCSALVSFDNIYIAPSGNTKNIITINNSPISGDVIVPFNSYTEITLINTLIKSLELNYSSPILLENVIVTNNPNLKSIKYNHSTNNLVAINHLTLDASNNPNLEEIYTNCNNDCDDSYSKFKNLKVKNNQNLKKIIGLDTEKIDFSTDGLINLEELDISYNYKSSFLGYLEFGNTTSINLEGLPKLKKFIAKNQSFKSIDLSKTPLLEEINLTNTISHLKSLNLSDFKKLSKINLNVYPYSYNNESPKIEIKELKINNNNSLEQLEFFNLNQTLENFELRNNENLKSLKFNKTIYSNYLSNENTSFIISDNPKLESINLYEHKFISLDLSKNKSLKYLRIGENLGDIDLLNIRNGSSKEIEFDSPYANIEPDDEELSKFPKITNICVNDRQVESMKKKYPKSNIITDCNNSLSTNDINTNTISIYPNPIKDYLEIKSLEAIKAIEMISSSGERIFSKSNINNNHFKTNLSNLKAGVYILKIETGNKIEIKKVIKK